MIVKLENLIKRYGDKTVVDIDNFKFENGYVYGIVGPNGAGKSTLIRMIAGLEENYSGKITYSSNGNEYLDFKSVKDNITMQHQKPYLFDMSVGDNIRMPLKLKKSSDLSLGNKIIDILKLNDIQHKNANRISGGEILRTALGRTLATDANLILLDEPTASVDPENTRIIEDVIINMKRKDKTFIIITHNVFQAIRLSDIIVCMENGRIAEVIESKNARDSKRINELINYTMQI